MKKKNTRNRQGSNVVALLPRRPRGSDAPKAAPGKVIDMVAALESMERGLSRRQLLAVLAFLEDEPLTNKRLDLEARVVALLGAAAEPDAQRRTELAGTSLGEAIAFAHRHGEAHGITWAVMRRAIKSHGEASPPLNGMEWLQVFDLEARRAPRGRRKKG